MPCAGSPGRTRAGTGKKWIWWLIVEADFFLRVVDAQITFDVGADGSVTGMVLHQNGQSVPGRKVEQGRVAPGIEQT